MVRGGATRDRSPCHPFLPGQLPTPPHPLTGHHSMPPSLTGGRFQAPSWVRSQKGQEEFDTGKAISNFLLAVIR